MRNKSHFPPLKNSCDVIYVCAPAALYWTLHSLSHLMTCAACMCVRRASFACGENLICEKAFTLQAGVFIHLPPLFSVCSSLALLPNFISPFSLILLFLSFSSFRSLLVRSEEDCNLTFMRSTTFPSFIIYCISEMYKSDETFTWKTPHQMNSSYFHP